MNARIKEIAAAAGFVFWKDESWNTNGQLIDWSCDYDKELEKFAELLIKEFTEPTEQFDRFEEHIAAEILADLESSNE